MTDLAAWLGIAVAIVVGAIGWVFAGVANSRVRAANKEAAKSNLLAEQAVLKAELANRIAQDANKLREAANSLAARSIAAQNEDWHVDWQVAWNKSTVRVVLKNLGRDAAHDVSVTIAGGGVYVVETWPDGVPASTDVAVNMNQGPFALPAQRLRENSRKVMLKGDWHGPPLPPLDVNLEVSIRWRTGMGFPKSQDLEVRVN